ncbi:MAG: molybdopterin-dependent oxidoreductase, partial [Gallionella sp.]|nr:molybdopterin-dependent oxidoreductase [Gallionella sp.]
MPARDSGIQNYDHPAAGWGALRQVAVTLLKERVEPGRLRMLLAQNQPEGFDCPGCAWPDRNHASTFEFCENGVKAVAAESTSRRADASLFARYSVAELLRQSDFELEQHGRLTEPMVYDAASDHYRPISWGDAFALIARELQALPDPDQAAFYTSGRTSNEAAYLFQWFVRAYGTNNFPDCSNMCHEATS